MHNYLRAILREICPLYYKYVPNSKSEASLEMRQNFDMVCSKLFSLNVCLFSVWEYGVGGVGDN